MKNPTTQFDIFEVKQNNKTERIAVSYSKSGVARAWHGYSDYCIAYAGGYGYCKQSTVLANAIARMGEPSENHKGYLYGQGFTVEDTEAIYRTAGAGWEAVANACEKQNIIIEKIW